jgi:OOP family OmpA-OmpF porin
MIKINKLLTIVMGISLLILVNSTKTMAENYPAEQQDIKASLFKEANKAMKDSKEVNADILSPKNFSDAMKYYQDADSDFQKGKNLEDIRKKLRASVVYFNKAMEATKIAEVTLAHAIKARSDANQASASQYSSKTWAEAELKFNAAARELEGGDVNNAKKRSGEAETIYRKAELEAVKVNYLNETWSLLKQADEMDVKKYAPTTLKKARDLITQAEKELNENRYDTDVARSLARQAKYEAQHAIYISKIIKELRDNKDYMEEFLLSTEKPLDKIASTMDLVGSFEAGYDKTTNEIVKYVQALQDRAAKSDQDLAVRDQQVEMLNARIAELEKKLGGVEKEKSELAMQMEAQAKIREQFAAVEKLFGREEANVLRKGNDVIVRLVGLSFPVGKSTIEPQNFGLLTKVQQAINMFPNCGVTIEGHTDSHGSDEKNMILSQERAVAVSKYIQANTNIDVSRITAVGYGESKPIGNNETKEGREKNRRIEVIIHPKL